MARVLVEAGPLPAGQRIVYATHTTDAQKYRIYRKQSADDSNANDVTLLGTTPTVGDRMSIAVDRGDIYVFYETASGELAYRKFFPEGGWDASETVIGTSPSSYPTARQNLGDGSVDVAWSKGSQRRPPRGLSPLMDWRVIVCGTTALLMSDPNLSRASDASNPSLGKTFGC